jgi:hypothetical protein
MRHLKNTSLHIIKGLFGRHVENNFRLDDSLKDDIHQVTNTENEALIKPFTEDEVKSAVFQMEQNKSLGPDGFIDEFYQVFWN